uniref:DNA-directed DNA polymerase family A palm domain-containing protein n=1 Tax=Halimeda micronesica TaxID=170426 RepID=A0A386AXD4_9CHLO|nr:hypothetical protein [Halimeda micronesica]
MEQCLDMWPRTPTSDQLKLGRDHLIKFIFFTQMSSECETWFANFLKYKTVHSDLTNSAKLNKFIHNKYIFPSWDIFGAATGRITTRQPALNSTPRATHFRNMFKANRSYGICEHHDQASEDVFIICDYSQIELMIMAVISGDDTMLEILHENKDLHIFLASQVLERPYDELMALKTTNPTEYKKIRTPMKSVNFGLLYGMGVFTLWTRLIAQGFQYTKEEVSHIHRVWTDTY